MLGESVALNVAFGSPAQRPVADDDELQVVAGKETADLDEHLEQC